MVRGCLARMHGDNAGETPAHRFEPTLILEAQGLARTHMGTMEISNPTIERESDNYIWVICSLGILVILSVFARKVAITPPIITKKRYHLEGW